MTATGLPSDVPKILVLLSDMILLTSLVRSFFSAERTRVLPGGTSGGLGNAMALSLPEAMPGLIINEKLVSAGRVPSEAEITTSITNAPMEA